MPKTYLGDGVYADFDGHCLTLTTENRCGPTNTIILEPDVIDEFNLFARAIVKQLRAHDAESN